MAEFMTGADTALKIGTTSTAPATQTKAGYEALTWVEVANVESIGEIGAESAIASFTALKGGVRKRKGSANFGTLTVTVGRDATDAGHIRMVSAADPSEFDPFPIHIQFQDQSSVYCMALVTSYKAGVPGADSVIMSTFNLELDTKPVWVAAT